MLLLLLLESLFAHQDVRMHVSVVILCLFRCPTGFDTTKHIESFYASNPISAAPEQREELKLRRELCSDALKSYVTNHYTSFIATTAAVVSIEADMLKLNNLLGQFQVGLRNLQNSSSSFHYDDEKLHAKLKSIEAAAAAAHSGGGSSAEGLLGAAATSTGGSGQHPAEVELEELCEELRGLIYERKFDTALATLESAQEKVRRRARDIEKQQSSASSGSISGGPGGATSQATGFDNMPFSPTGAGGWGSGGAFSAGGSSSSSSSNNNGMPTPFQQLAIDLLSLRQTLIEMLFSELRAAASTNPGGLGPRGAAASSVASPKGKRGGGGGAVARADASASSFQLSRIVLHLLNLRQSRKAMQVFLYVVKSAHVRASIRAIKFTGDIVAYIGELSSKFFSGIGMAVQEFQRLFRQQADAAADAPASGGGTGGGGGEGLDNPSSLNSYLVRWVLHETLHTFNAIFQKQVFQSEGTFQKLGKCIRYAFYHCALLEGRGSASGGGGGGGSAVNSPLAGTGLSLSFVLSRMFTPSLVDVIASNYRHVEQLIAEELAVEAWRVSELWVTEKDKQASKEEERAARGRKDSSALAYPTIVVKKKRALKLTSSAKYLYDVVRNLLRELVPILDVHGSASSSSSSSSSSSAGGALGGVSWSVSAALETRLELYPTVVSGMQSLLEAFLMAMVQELKSKLLSQLEDAQALSIMANAFYLHEDLVPRVIKEFRKHFSGGSSSSSSSSSSSTAAAATSIPELEEFNARLNKLYKALRSSFCSKRASLLWPFERHLCFNTKLLAGSNRYANPMGLSSSGELASVTNEWVAFAEGYLVSLHATIGRCINAGEVEPILTLALEELMETLMEGQFALDAGAGGSGGASARAAASANNNGDACVWHTYLFGLGGLQQFVLDLKFLVRSCGGRLGPPEEKHMRKGGGGANNSSASAAASVVSAGGFLTARAAESVSLLLARCIQSYSSMTSTPADDAWTRATLGWVDAAVEKRVANAKTNLAKCFAADRERDRAEREKESEAQKAAAMAEKNAAATKAAASSTSSGSGTGSAPASSSIAQPQKGVRRGSTITPEQMALLNAVGGGGAAAAGGVKKLSPAPSPAASPKADPNNASNMQLPASSARDRERERERRRKQREDEEEDD
jgi:hypothetical protein